MKNLIFASLLCSGAAFGVHAQEFKMPAPSPSTTIHQDFSVSAIEIEYSRPSMKGRKIFGDLIPYGKVWRTGANSATKITFKEDVKVNGYDVKAGSYSLYTIPNANEWTIILNKNTGNWGTSGFDKKDDVAEFTVPVKRSADKVETFTIGVENISNTACDIVLAWENTRVPVRVTADNDAKIMAYLDKELAGSKPPYAQAAGYYLENNKDLSKALEYTTKAIEANPKAFYLHWLKARIYQKQGNKEAALAEAKLAADGAPAPYALEYQNNYNRLKEEMQ